MISSETSNYKKGALPRPTQKIFPYPQIYWNKEQQRYYVMPELIRTITKAVMQAERKKYLNAAPYERDDKQRGYANGYKPKPGKTRVGKGPLYLPQLQVGRFYLGALEKGLRNERALLLSMAEMYIQGASTRKAAAITEQFCVYEVLSS